MNPFPVIISAPSGGGKTTITRALLAKRVDLGYSVSCTTRKPRAGEVDGRDYYFLSRSEFIDRLEAGGFAESAEVHGNWYGTLHEEIQRVLAAGRHVVMDIDVQGATQLRRSFPGSVTVFVLPPSGDVLLDRLRSRQTESRGEVLARLQSALQELRAVDEYEYIVINEVVDEAVRRVSAIIDAEVVSRKRVADMRHQVAALIARLESEINSSPKEMEK
jgi:guanylate kinase